MLVDCTGRLVSSPAGQAGEAKEGVAGGGAHLHDAERRSAGPPDAGISAHRALAGNGPSDAYQMAGTVH